MPVDIAWRQRTALSEGMKPGGLDRAIPEHVHGAFISGCRTDQTSADAFIDNQYRGALSATLLAQLANGGLTMTKPSLVLSVRTALQAQQFEQEPQLRGDPTAVSRPWLQ